MRVNYTYTAFEDTAELVMTLLYTKENTLTKILVVYIVSKVYVGLNNVFARALIEIVAYKSLLHHLSGIFT